MFSTVKYYKTGDLRPCTVSLLQEGGAKSLSYISSLATHCIVGDMPEKQDIEVAEEVLELPAVTEEWVVASARCCHILPVRGFSTSSCQLFSGITLIMDTDTLDKEDCNKLWAMMSWYGGQIGNNEEGGTHLVCGGWSNIKEGTGLIIVIPDWVVESIKKGLKLNELDYHPSLFFELEEKRVLQCDAVCSNNNQTEYYEDVPLDVTKDQSLIDKKGDSYEDDLDDTKEWKIHKSCASGVDRIMNPRIPGEDNIEGTSNDKDNSIVIKIKINDEDSELNAASKSCSSEPDPSNSSLSSSYRSAESSIVSTEYLDSSTTDYFSQNSAADLFAETKKNWSCERVKRISASSPNTTLPQSSVSSSKRDVDLQTNLFDVKKHPDVSISDTSSTNSEFLHTKGSIAGKRKLIEEDTMPLVPFHPMKKYKSEIQSSSSCVKPVSRRWSESDKFRKGYSRVEALALINFFKRQGLYSLKGGTQVWKIIEKASICPGRSWQSMKCFFLKYLMKQLPNYGVTEKELDDMDRKKTVGMGKWKLDEGGCDSAEIVTNFYTEAEDKEILKYLIDQGKVEGKKTKVGGNRLWKMLEKKSVTGRSWQSMKERFRKKIVKNINNYNINESDMKIMLDILE